MSIAVKPHRRVRQHAALTDRAARRTGSPRALRRRRNRQRRPRAATAASAKRAHHRHGTPIHLWVQHGANSPFKRGRTCNGRRRQPGAAVHAERAREIDQVRGVRGAADAEVEDDVVAGVFAFAAQPRAGDPEQRVEPVDRARHFGEQLDQPVAADEVRHLVREHQPHAIRRPRSAIGRQQNHRRDRAPRHEQRRMRASSAMRTRRRIADAPLNQRPRRLPAARPAVGRAARQATSARPRRSAGSRG